MGNVMALYAQWHYTRALKELLINEKNFISFLGHFFSIGLLLKTLFHPWRRMKEQYTGALNLGAMASSLLVNLIMRIVGLVSRLALICMGLLSMTIASVLSLGLFVFWLALPAVALLSIAAGITLLI